MLLTNFFGHDLDMSKAQAIGTIHHAILVVCAALAIIGTLFYALKIKVSKHENKTRYILIVLLIFLEISYHIHNWTAPLEIRLERGPSVPIHISSIALLMCIALLYTGSKKVFNYAFVFGTIGGFIALVLPNTWGYTYLNFRYYHFLVLHVLIMIVPLYYYKAYNYRIDYKTTLHVFRSAVLLGITVYIINGFLDTNYWFIREIPVNVASVFKNWNVYIICYWSLVFFTMNILYLVTNLDAIFKKKA